MVTSKDDSDDPEKQHPDKSKSLWRSMDRSLVKQLSILTGSQLVLNLGFAQMVPVMPMFAAQMGGHLGATGIGLILSAPSAATLLLNVPAGRLCDTIGRKPLMWCGTLFTAVGAALTGFSTSLVTLLPCRLMVGAGSALSMSGATAYITDLSDRAPQHRAKIMGINQAVIGSMWVVGPAFGGWLADAYGYQNSFFIAAGGALLCSLGYTRLPETLRRPKSVEVAGAAVASGTVKEETGAAGMSLPSRSGLRAHVAAWREDIGPILRDPNQQALVANACIFPLRFCCISTAVALHATMVMGAGPKELGLMFTAMALCQGLGMPLGAWLADRAPGARKSLIIPAGLVSCGAFGMMAAATVQSHFVVAMAIQGFCGAFSQPAVGAFTAEVTPPDKRGQAMSLQRQASSGLALAGPISIGLLADATSCQTAILVSSALMACCTGMYAWRAKSTPVAKPEAH